MRILVFNLVAWCLILYASLSILGCSSAPSREPETPATSLPPPSSDRRTETIPLETSRPTYAGPWEDPSSPLYNRTIYFDYDTAEIKPDYIPVMRTHARYLGSRTDTRVMLEGHADERGTREYNLALGDQRAETVRRYMLAEGVLPDQMATLSYGEERPADPGHGEGSWRLNRRVIIQY